MVPYHILDKCPNTPSIHGMPSPFPDNPFLFLTHTGRHRRPIPSNIRPVLHGADPLSAKLLKLICHKLYLGSHHYLDTGLPQKSRECGSMLIFLQIYIFPCLVLCRSIYRHFRKSAFKRYFFSVNRYFFIFNRHFFIFRCFFCNRNIIIEIIERYKNQNFATLRRKSLVNA